MRRILVAAFVFLAAQASVFAQERIVSFISDVRVQTNGDLDVTETISVFSEIKQIRRGIYRRVSNQSADKKDTAEVQVISVARNGKPENFAAESVESGVRIRIGDADVLLTQGEHTYVIRYRVTKMTEVGEFFHALVWNATGSWNFRIDFAEARITLPDGARISEQSFFLGPKNGNPERVRVVEESANRIVWRIGEPLQENESLSLVLLWRNGIASPHNRQ